MVDQSQEEEGIQEVQTKNKQIKYASDTAKMFDEWLKQCPVVYYSVSYTHLTLLTIYSV